MATLGKCPICETPLHHSQAKYCRRCRKILNRVDTRRKHNLEARVAALIESWDGQGFRCHYSGILLNEDNPKDPRYLTFDHLIPRQEDKIVLVAAAINDMKSDMDDREFKVMVIQLANRFSGGEFNEKVFNLKHWKR